MLLIGMLAGCTAGPSAPVDDRIIVAAEIGERTQEDVLDAVERSRPDWLRPDGVLPRRPAGPRRPVPRAGG
ncbi:hypothetical protein C5C27_13880 [Rathayibacter sp. AY2B7]|uniref:hypothetical protein n=1 Tax=Rathayibacter sp. AY2B7 TaxID=2080571 RepID=UPI000CE7FCDF|nr:hypothetical protein [Rathayibacter sp. AY2B7]PPG55778.1 hypothetical protein C5C27_13880 [Rathayibacter sp. AY2B7]